MVDTMLVVATLEESQAELAKLRDERGATIDWAREEASVGGKTVLVSRACPRRIPGIRATFVKGVCPEHRRFAVECYERDALCS